MDKETKRRFREYEISFSGLKDGVHQFDFEVGKPFFEAFGYEEFNDAKQHVAVQLTKKPTLMELALKAQGTVNVNCDVTDITFDLPTESELNLVVKFGEEFNDENEELLVLPYGEHSMNVAQYIYEMIVLSLPAKRVHPGVADGTLHSEALDRLQELSPKEKETLSDTQEIDPRWNELKKLFDNNNTN